jgi:hypothetical protein
MTSPKGFSRLLRELARDHPDPALLEDPDWLKPALLAEFVTQGWARGKASESDPRTAFVLLVAYFTRLLLEQVRFGCKRYLRLGTMLFLAQFVWPPYEVWVGENQPLPGDRSLSASLSWLTAPGRVAAALRELGVSDAEAPELRITPQDLDRDRSTLYLWLARARDLVYREIRRELDGGGSLPRKSSERESAVSRPRSCEAPGSYLVGPGRGSGGEFPAIRGSPRRGHSSSWPMRSSPEDP